MLAFWGILTIILLLILIMSKKVSAIVALIMVPIVTALFAGFGTEIFGFITSGVQTISTTGVMFIFAILFFGILTDAGTFRPIIERLIKLAGNDPARVAVATSLLAMIVHLDGSGAVTFLITIPAMLPLYDELGMKRSTLATIVALSAGTMNILPWGGPTIRAATSLNISVTELFNPLLIPVCGGLLFVLFVSWFLGKRERSDKTIPQSAYKPMEIQTKSNPELERPKLFYVNILLIIISIGVLISGFAPPHIVFMIAFALAISINYPNLKVQAERINEHAKAALLMAGILFAAGCLTGILKESGMIEAMANTAVAFIPTFVGEHMAVITGVTSMPASLLFDPDSFYFGILPLLSETSAQFGGLPVEVGRGAIIGQMTTGFPVSPLTGSTYLLVGLTGVDLGEHQRKTIPFAFAVSMVILFLSIIFGAISW